MRSNIKKFFIYILVFWYLFLISFFFFSRPRILPVIFNDTPTYYSLDDIDFILKDSLSVKVGDNKFQVPAKFQTDFGAIPLTIWSYMSNNQENYTYPSILHDYLYSCPAYYNRKAIDEIFYSFLISQGVNPFKAYQLYALVRVFGWMHFSQHGCDIRVVKTDGRRQV